MGGYLSEFCEHIGCSCYMNEDKQGLERDDDSYIVMLELAAFCSQLSIKYVKKVKSFFAISFRNIFGIRNFAAEAKELMELQKSANYAMAIVDEIDAKTSESAEFLFHDISDSQTKQLEAMREFLCALDNALGQLILIAKKLSLKSKGENYSVSDYKADMAQFRRLDNYWDQTTRRLEAVVKGWC